MHDKWKAEAWRFARLGERPRHTWQEAVVRWLKETAHKATTAEDKRHLRWLDAHLHGKHLDEITRDAIERVTEARLSAGVANATVNRTLAVLRAILRRAMLEWEWLDRMPKVRLLPEPKRRVRFLTREEADKLLAALPEHLAEMARFTLATGLRERNVARLEWPQVDLERRHVVIHADQAKARRAIAVPLNAEAVLVLRRQAGKHKTRVFTYQPPAREGKPRKPPRPVVQANTRAWREALKRAGIKDFRWHDLRHTWASWHVQQGTPLHVLQELGGWETVQMVHRYAHLTSDHLREYADRLAQPRVVGSDVFATVPEGDNGETPVKDGARRGT